MTFSSASAFAIVSAGVFLLVGLFSGLWKFLQMWRSEQGLAHPYLDIAHRASLLYGFACLTLAVLAHFSTFSPNYNLFAAVTVIVFFALAVAGDLIQAALNGPDLKMNWSSLPSLDIALMNCLGSWCYRRPTSAGRKLLARSDE